jgi:hypothetical protein
MAARIEVIRAGARRRDVAQRHEVPNELIIVVFLEESTSCGADVAEEQHAAGD